MPRVKRAQPVERVVNIETAPKGRRIVATGEASAASATRGQRCPIFFPPRRGEGWLPRVERAQRAQPVVSGTQLKPPRRGGGDVRRVLPVPRFLRPSGAGNRVRPIPTGCAAPSAPLHPWQQSSAPPGRAMNLRPFHGLRSAFGVAPPVATVRRPSGAEETPGAPRATGALCPFRASSAPSGRVIHAPRCHGLRSAFGVAPPVATVRRPSGAEDARD